MKNEIAELVRDVREQVVYLNELGVDSLDAKMREAPPADAPSEERTAAPLPIQKPPAPKIEIEAPPKKTRAGARLASLPSLTRRTPMSQENVSPATPDHAPEPAT